MSNKKGCGEGFRTSIFILSSWRGVHRQIWRVYFPWRFNEIEKKAGKLGIDKILGNLDFETGRGKTFYHRDAHGGVQRKAREAGDG
jgi:hypothetical protein